MAFTLFHGQNRISAKESTNHWLPFTEQEVDAKEKFTSHFMTDFMSGRITPADNQPSDNTTLFEKATENNLLPTAPLEFSEESTAVFDAGRELWKYYHSCPNAEPNASLYDIREYFQGRNEKGRMNSKSNDEHYMELIGNLRDKLKILAEKIQPKVFEYGFLRA